MRERERERFKVTFLLDKSNIWIKKHLLKYDFNIKNKYIFKITNDHNLIKNQDIVFPLSYTKILSEDFLNKNKLTLIAHASKLPKDKGFAPVQYQILKNHKKIYISLIKAAKEVDAGDIYLRDFFILKGFSVLLKNYNTGQNGLKYQKLNWSKYFKMQLPQRATF